MNSDKPVFSTVPWAILPTPLLDCTMQCTHLIGWRSTPTYNVGQGHSRYQSSKGSKQQQERTVQRGELEIKVTVYVRWTNQWMYRKITVLYYCSIQTFSNIIIYSIKKKLSKIWQHDYFYFIKCVDFCTFICQK